MQQFYVHLLVLLCLQSLMKQSSLDDHDSLGMDLDSNMGQENGDELMELSEYDERRPTEPNDNNLVYNPYQNRPSSPSPSPMPASRGLPWKPKVRQKDIDLFLENARLKFVGYNLQGDRATLAGLPQPIHEGVKTLREVCQLFYLFLKLFSRFEYFIVFHKKKRFKIMC